MGCGKSKQAVATVDNTAVLSRKKSSSGSVDVERKHNVTAADTNENNPNTINDNGDKASEEKQKKKENGGHTSTDTNKNENGNVSSGDVRNDTEEKTKTVQAENPEGEESTKSVEFLGLDHGDKKNPEVIVIPHEKTESEGKTAEKAESDIPILVATNQDSVSDNVEVDDTVVEEEKNGEETKEETANDAVVVNEEMKAEHTLKTDVTASTPEYKSDTN